MSNRAKLVASAAFYMLALATQVSDYHSTIAAVALAVIATLLLAFPLWDWINTWRDKRGNPRFRLEPSHIIWIGAIGAVVFGLIAVGGLVWQNVRSPANLASLESIDPRVHIQVVAPPLSPGEQQFRTELRRFIKSNFDEIRDGVYTVNQFVTSKYDEERNPLSRIFLQLFATAIRPHIDAVDMAYDLQDDEFDTNIVQDLIKKALQSYAQWQEIMLQFQQVSGFSLTDRSLVILLGADERAFGKLRDLKAFSYATKLNDLDERSIFASRNGVFSQWYNATRN